MNKRGGIGDILLDNVIYLVLLGIFIASITPFVLGQMNGGDVWADYYAKEIAKVIDFSKPGDKICLDVHKASEIAKNNNIRSFSEIFKIDNVKNEICVKLSSGRATCFDFFNDVDVINAGIELGFGKDGKNIFCFEINEASK